MCRKWYGKAGKGIVSLKPARNLVCNEKDSWLIGQPQVCPFTQTIIHSGKKLPAVAAIWKIACCSYRKGQICDSLVQISFS